MQFAACVGFDEITDSHSSLFVHGGHYGQNIYIGQNFFEDKNYQAILDCLDGGIEVAKALIKSMEEYRDLQQGHADRLLSYSKQCTARVKHLSSLSTYYTTMEVQLQTYQSFENQAKLIKDSCDIIQQVIDKYKKQVDKMYPRVRFSSTHKHYQTNEMKNLFKQARSPLCKVLDKLEQLRIKEKKVLHALHKGTVEFETLNLDSSTNEKQNKLQDIQEDIVNVEEKRAKKEIIYITEATKIFKKCQKLEIERLDQIGQTLISFIHVVHPSQYSTALVTMYEDLLMEIKTKQNSIADTHYWAQTYGAHTLASRALPETNQNDNDSETSEDEDDEQ